MKEEIEIYCGNGKGKSTLAMGLSIKAALQEKSVIIIQFLKGKELGEYEAIENLNGVDIKIFRFEKLDAFFEDLTPEEQEEESRNIRNGVNFARKVIATDECDFLVLDEILGLPDIGIITEETIEDLLKARRDEGMHIVMTGRVCPDSLRKYADRVTTLTTE
ncbi:MAG: cob(I)yrinic acid a,c-diamide adenosyltransferase [Blautia sp.]|nr:cob(I)yrinic acid a,c-diamide adenosyltransferase [Blautia sp.]